MRSESFVECTCCLALSRWKFEWKPLHPHPHPHNSTCITTLAQVQDACREDESCGHLALTHDFLYSAACDRDFFTNPASATPLPVVMAYQLPDLVDSNLDHLLQAIRGGLLLHPAHAGAVRIVIESETGEPLHVVKIHARRSLASKAVLPPRHPATPFAELIAATSAVQGDSEESRHEPEQRLLHRCHEQQQRIAELEQQLRQVQQELHHHARPLSPASSTDDGSSSSNASPRPTDDDGPELNLSSDVMMDDADYAPSSTSSPTLSAPGISTTVRKSERSKTNVERWSPPTLGSADVSASPSSSHIIKRKTKKRRTRSGRDTNDDDDGVERSLSSDMHTMEVGSSDDEDDADVDGAVEVAALVVKLREGHNKRQSIALDTLSKASVLTLYQQVLDEGGDLVASTISGQITALITTSTSLRMVGYFLRAILAHRLKFTSQKCYKRLARETLGVKSPADIAAYPALFELVQHHYPGLATSTIEVWLENPVFTADITWTEWKRYLTKSGRPVIDAALQQFNTAMAPSQDWLQLSWVEVYDDDKLGQGVRALRDIRMPPSKGKEAQRDIAASISVVVADLHCAGSEFVKVRDPTLEVDPEYLIQMDKERVFDARLHWIGKINHLPMPHCNLKMTGNGKLVQVKPIHVGEALTWDYGMDYWVYQVTRLDVSEWLSAASSVCQRSRSELFVRMHESVLDYSGLLRQGWARSLSSASSATDKEGVLLELEDWLDAHSIT